MKRRWSFILIVLAAFPFAAWCLLSWRANTVEKEWMEFVAGWEKEGEKFDIESHLPKPLPPDQEFAAHPWIRKIAENDADVLQLLDQMKPGHVNGYDDWNDETNDDGVHRPMPPELAKRIIEHAAGFRSDLNGFAEAARCPNCRIIADGREMTGAMAWCPWMARLTPVRKLLEASAQAYAALGDGPSLTRDLETLLRAGSLLRSSNLNIGVIEGSGFEGAAYRVLRELPDLSAWSESDCRRWLAALDSRTRTLPDEFAASSRLERGFFLKQLDLLAADRSVRIAGGLNGHGPFRRMYLAQARLAACGALQGMVFSEGGHLCAVIDPQRIAHFQNHIRKLQAKAHHSRAKVLSAEEFGMLPQVAIVGIQDALILHEAERTSARERIGRTLP